MQPERRTAFNAVRLKLWCVFMTRAVACVISGQGPPFSKMAVMVMQCLESGWAAGRYKEECEVSTFNSYYPVWHT